MNGEPVELAEVDEALDGAIRKRWQEIDRIIREAALAICEERALARIAKEEGTDLAGWRGKIWQRASPDAAEVDSAIARGKQADGAAPSRADVEYLLRVQAYRRSTGEAAKERIGKSFSLALPPEPISIQREPELPPIVASCLGDEISAEEIERFAAYPLFRRRAEVVSSTCRQFEVDYSSRLLAQRAAKRGTLPDPAVTEVAPEPSAEEVEALAESRYGNKQPASLAKAKLALEATRQGDARMALVEKVRRETTASCSLALPSPPVVETLGGESAPGPLEVLYFGAFRCKLCADGWRTLARLRERWGERIRFELRHHFPDATRAFFQDALEAECSEAQGRLDAYARWRLANQENGKAVAQALGLDAAKFEACLANPATAVKVLDDSEEAQRLGFRDAIPSWVIGQTPRRGFQGNSVLDASIEAQLQSSIAGEPSKTAAPAPGVPGDASDTAAQEKENRKK